MVIGTNCQHHYEIFSENIRSAGGKSPRCTRRAARLPSGAELDQRREKDTRGRICIIRLDFVADLGKILLVLADATSCEGFEVRLPD